MVEAAFTDLLRSQHSGDREDARAKIAALTPRERDVLTGLIDGQANKVIGHNLDVSPRTVEVYRANLMSKLSVRSHPGALRIAFAVGIVPFTI